MKYGKGTDLSWPDYELIDFGTDPKLGGRRLEKFGSVIVDRPCPAAEGTRKEQPHAWREAMARYEGSRAADGIWKPSPKRWSREDQVCHVPLKESSFSLAIDPTPAGQIGFFPEQFVNWQWIADQASKPGQPLRVLNLFAYTGGSTLSAASAGAEVTHVDASKPSVERARANAELSGLADAPIRWIVEDAVKYCRREVKRGSLYDGIILDPPSYGHGPKREEWRLERDLPELLGLCAELCERAPTFFLTTCHTPGIGPAELSAYMSDAIVGHCGQPPASGRLWLTSAEGRRIESGVFARWPK